MFQEAEREPIKTTDAVQIMRNRIEERKAARKAQKAEAKAKFLESLKPGVILEGSWGYEQTNVEFFKVLSVKGSKVVLQEVGHQTVEGSEANMSCKVVPSENAVGVSICRTIMSDSIKINESVRLWRIWDGKPAYKSWYY